MPTKYTGNRVAEYNMTEKQVRKYQHSNKKIEIQMFGSHSEKNNGCSWSLCFTMKSAMK